jgi:peptidoglycan/LPS O-acetylase OafA/YrhL
MVLRSDPRAQTAPASRAPAARPAAGRSWGVDLARAFAAAAVVVIHACAAGGAAVSAGTVTLREVASFAVPFFLATSATFAVRSINENRSAWAVVRQRLGRLLLPYAAWSVIYVGLKALSARLADDPERLDALFRDPGRLVLLGGASVQLYFLPMLATGIVLLPFVDSLTRRLRYRADAIGFAALALVPYWFLGWTGNAYDIATATGLRDWIDPERTRALDAVVRVLVVALVWALRLLPYLALGVVVRVFALDRARPRWLLAAAALAFVTVEVAFRPFQPLLLRELAVSFPLLLVGFGLRSPRAGSIVERAVSSIAKHSFGIFLAHTAVLQVVQDLADRADAGFLSTITPAKVALTAVPTFLLAWLGAAIIDRIRPLRRLLVAG